MPPITVLIKPSSAISLVISVSEIYAVLIKGSGSNIEYN